MLLKPPRLRPGDRVAAVSLSWGGPAAFPHRYEAGKRQLSETFNVEVVEMPHTLREAEWLARHPEARAADLMQAFADPSIAAIFSTIGGDDSIRLLPHLDLDVIAAHPKIFMGYSDTTVTHIASMKAGLSTFYGPSIMAGFAENAGMFPYMIESVQRTLFGSEPVGEIKPNVGSWTADFLDWGDAANQEQARQLTPTSGWRWLQGAGVHEGHLIGGCLEVLDWLRGTTIWPNHAMWQGAILFLETSEEAPSPTVVARILRSFAAMGILDQLAGLIFGRPGGNVPAEQWAAYDTAILNVVTGEQGLVNLPIITGMDFGHTDPMFVLPYGAQAVIDTERKQFRLAETATR